jgi:hypothetical protein
MRSRTPPAPEEHLGHALLDMVVRPHRSLLPAWSWKAACFSALVRAGTFFIDNLRSGGSTAIRAFLVEAMFAIVAGGLLGAVSQRLRVARPLWATAIFVWLAMPAVLVLVQLLVHRLAKTPHMGSGVAAAFCYTAVASSYSWFAMRHGALLGGEAQTSLRSDVRLLPGITRDYILTIPNWLTNRKFGDSNRA